MNLLEAVAWQVRYAARSLVRRPVLALVALTTLALGIGANTAIFSVINAVLLKPLPFANPTRLVMVWSTAPSQGLAEGFSSYPDFRDWRERARSFDGVAAFWTFPNGDVNLTGGSEPQRVSVARVTPGFFEVLGVPPLHGRTFQEEETVLGNHRRAILSYDLWRNQFGADTSLIGKAVMVNGLAYTVVGVMPREVASRSVRVLGTDVQLWRPLVPEDNQTGGRGSRRLRVVGRLAPGVTLQQAEAELSGVAAQLRATWPETNREIGVHLVPLREQVVRDVRRGLFFLLAAVGMVLLGASANVANLLLIKAAATRKQVAVQRALGASGLRLSGQVLTEGLLLGGAGALLGILFAYWGVKAFVAIGPADIPLLAGAQIDGRVLAFTLLVTLLTAVLVGLVPAWRASRSEATALLRQHAGRASGSDDRRIMRGLSVTQVALAMMLLTTGGLLIRNFRGLLEVDPGFDPDHLLSFQLELPMATTYPRQESRDAFFTTLLDRVQALPGVRSATIANAPPIEEEPESFTFTVAGSPDNQVFRAAFRMVTPEYFPLLGVPILQGRSFETADSRTGPPVVILSNAVARAAWGDVSPIGKRIASADGEEAEVVGVAGDVRTGGLDVEASRTLYMPTTQGGYNFMTVLVKTWTEPADIVPAVRAVVRELDPALPLHHVRSVEAIVTGSVAQQRFQMLLVAAFSALMYVLAVVGTYGVTAYGVSERANELGIRSALGATGRNIRRLVVGEGARLALLGIMIGGVLTAALSWMLSRYVVQVRALDPLSFLAASLALGFAAALATFIPAHRAARADPMQALRSD